MKKIIIALLLVVSFVVPCLASFLNSNDPAMAAYISGDHVKALELYMGPALSGDPKAQYMLGKIFQTKATSEEDIKAFYWFKRAADQSYTDAEYEIAIAYNYAKGTEKNMNEAFKYYFIAGNKNSTAAQMSLGLLYLSDEYSNDKEAIKWFSKAAVLGLPDAQWRLANMYINDLKDPSSAQEYFKWSKHAADQGFEPAMINVSLAYRDGINIDKDPKEAFKWMEKAAEGEFNTEAKVFLAYYYQKGIGVKANPKEAFKRYSYLVENSINKDAMIRLSDCYDKGIGTKKDKKKAKYWLDKSKE